MGFARIWTHLRPLAREAVAALYPHACALCAADDLGDGAGCAEHRLSLRDDSPRCGRCAAALAPILPDRATCAACRADPPAFAVTACLFDYRDAKSREWVLALKHGGRRDLADPLGRLLGARLLLEAPSERRRVLVPVPLHPTRRLERGYDQARLLAEAAGTRARLDVVRALERVRATAPQGSTGGPTRAANVRAAFAPRRFARRSRARLAGAECWLVDDVLTTGATASECARVLKSLGAARVHVLVLARA